MMPLLVCMCLVFLFPGCATKRPMWAVTVNPKPPAVLAALEQDPYYPYRGDIDPVQLPQFNPPMRLRPCCVLGMDVKVSVKTIPIPLYHIVNIVDPETLGPHTYDAGFFGGYGTDKNVGTNENNGIVYTCRGGFVDTAHVRDYSDLTLFLFFHFFRHLDTSFDIDLRGELGPKVILVDFVEVKGGRFERARVALRLASWTAYQLSLWHEIAQWHGYREFSLFSEEPSAYSLEDAYSNLVGISIANALVYSSLVFNDNQYGRNFDTWCKATLETLGAVSREESRMYMAEVDGLWWDSKQRLPEKFFVLKRNYTMDAFQVPSLISRPFFKKTDTPCPCPVDEIPLRIGVHDTLYGEPISNWVHISLFVDEIYKPSFAVGTAFNTHTDAITPDEFRAIAQADERFDVQSLANRGSPDEAGEEADP